MSAPNFRDWLKDGERELQEEVQNRNAPDEIQWPAKDDDDDRGGKSSRDDDPWSGRYARVARDVIERFAVACRLSTPLDLPRHHEWRRTHEDGWLPMEAGVVKAAGRVATLFGCSCTWVAQRSGYGVLEFRGFDDNPDHAMRTMRALVEEAVTVAIKQRPGGLANTSSRFQLRLNNFVNGFCAAIADQLTVFLKEREQAWQRSDGIMHIVIYASGQVMEPDVAGPSADDDDYRNGLAFGSRRA